MAKKRVTIEIPEKVKILGVSGSPRKAGNTSEMVKFCLEAAKSMGYVETEYISLANHHFTNCTDCKKCIAYNKPAGDPPMCYEDPSDETPMLHAKEREADGLLLGFPVYGGQQAGLFRISHEKNLGGGPFFADTLERAWWGSRYKPRAIISQGGQTFANQEAVYWFTARMGGALLSGSWPTVEDPEPQISFEGGILTCNDGKSVYAKDAWTSRASRISPPLTGTQNERTLRNLGRWLAYSTMMFKLARLACEEAEIKAPETQYFVRYAAGKPKPGSVLDKLVKEGKATYVSQEELESRKKVSA